jgi:hypothetical protein
LWLPLLSQQVSQFKQHQVLPHQQPFQQVAPQAQAVQEE